MSGILRGIRRWVAEQTAWEILRWSVVGKVGGVLAFLTTLIAWVLNRSPEWIILLALVGFTSGAVLVVRTAFGEANVGNPVPFHPHQFN